MANVTINNLPTASTIDGTADILPIYTASALATQGITRNTLLGITGSPVGNSDTQTLTNKTIGNTNTITVKDTSLTIQDVSDTTKRLRFELSGITTGTTRTLTVPDASDTIVGLAATQTLTNKTLTSPTISSPTITNATISTDAITGYSASTTGTIFGISITAGVVSTSNSVPGTVITNSSITASKLNLGPQAAFVSTLETTTSTSYADLATTTDSITVTVGANGNLVVAIYAGFYNTSSGATYVSFSMSGANTLAASDTYAIVNGVPTNVQNNFSAIHLLTGLNSGSTTIKMKYRVSANTGNYTNRRIWAVPL